MALTAGPVRSPHALIPPGRLLGRLRAIPAPLFSVADQGAVSGFSFLMGIGAARWLGIDGFGHVALVLIVTAFAQGLHNALVTAPMMTLAGARGRVGPAYGASLVIGAVALSVPVAAMVVCALAVGGSALPSLLLAAAALTLAQNLQFTLRRLLFARGDGMRAVVMDAGRALAFGLIAAVAWSAGLPLGPAGLVWCLAATAFATSVPDALRVAAPGIRRPRRLRLAVVARRHGPVAGWMFPIVFVTFAQEQAIWLAAGLMLGPDALGGLRAAQYLVGLVLLLLSATENVIPVRAAQAYAAGGVRGLERYLIDMAVKLGLPVGLALMAFQGPSELCLRLVFGPEYTPYAGCLRVLAVCGIVVVLRDLAAHHFRARQSTQVIFQALVVSLVVSAATALPLIDVQGVTGAALAVTLGHAASLVYLVHAIRSGAVATWTFPRLPRRLR